MMVAAAARTRPVSRLAALKSRNFMSMLHAARLRLLRSAPNEEAPATGCPAERGYATNGSGAKAAFLRCNRSPEAAFSRRPERLVHLGCRLISSEPKSGRGDFDHGK